MVIAIHTPFHVSCHTPFPHDVSLVLTVLVCTFGHFGAQLSENTWFEFEHVLSKIEQYFICLLHF